MRVFPRFEKKGFLFVPLNIAGWVILIASATYSIYLFFDIDSRSHSVSDTLINFIYNGMLIALGYTCIGLISEKLASVFHLE